MTKHLIKEKLKTAGPIILFMLVYIIWFCKLETVPMNQCYQIHSHFDSMIPFNRFFVVPYFGWFVFVPFVAINTLFRDETEFKHLQIVLILGMLMFLVINTFFPTAVDLRPVVVRGNDFFSKWVRWLYSTDTSTNVFPSIHVYNTIAAIVTLYRSKGQLARSFKCRFICTVTAVLIVLSTMFLKQHSVIDVTFAILMYVGIRYIEPKLYAVTEKVLFTRHVTVSER